MVLGVIVLVAYVLATTPWAELTSIGLHQWSWALLTGAILAGYVATWFSALARARAVDVTAILVFGAIVTALLQTGVDGVALAPQVFGLSLVALGCAVVTALALREPRDAQAAM
jgi:hypothetical protein